MSFSPESLTHSHLHQKCLLSSWWNNALSEDYVICYSCVWHIGLVNAHTYSSHQTLYSLKYKLGAKNSMPISSCQLCFSLFVVDLLPWYHFLYIPHFPQVFYCQKLFHHLLWKIYPSCPFIFFPSHLNLVCSGSWLVRNCLEWPTQYFNTHDPWVLISSFVYPVKISTVLWAHLLSTWPKSAFWQSYHPKNQSGIPTISSPSILSLSSSW